MMFLTRIRLRLPEALRLRLSDPYAWHRWLWKAFPDRDGQAREFLSRADRSEDFYEVLLLSPEAPTTLARGTWETRPVAPTFLEHNRYAFALRVNPTVKKKNESNAKNGRRVALRRHEELHAWIERKAQGAGFAIDAIQFDPPVDQPFRKSGVRGKHARVDFRGLLSVRDRAAFRNAYRHGIGPAKAFGFGLLLLKPVYELNKESVT